MNLYTRRGLPFVRFNGTGTKGESLDVLPPYLRVLVQLYLVRLYTSTQVQYCIVIPGN